MTSVIINDILPRTQLVASGGQTVYSTDWTANYPSDVVVYSRPAAAAANDVTQILNSSLYSVAFIGDEQEVQVTLITPSTMGDIITITRMTPADRENLYTNTNFTPSMLNNDFGILTLVDQQAQLVNSQIAPRYNYSALIEPVVDTILPILIANQAWVKNSNNTGFIGFTLGTAAGKTPTDNTLQYVASAKGPFTPGHLVVAADALGTIVDSGSFAGTGTVTTIGTNDGIAGGPITVAGTIVLAPVANNTLLANISGSPLYPSPTTLTELIDSSISNVQGSILYRNAAGWVALSPGPVGDFLKTNGAGANPQWETPVGDGTVNSSTINNLAWYAATGTTVSGLATSALGVLVTDGAGVPSISRTLPAGLTTANMTIGVITENVYNLSVARFVGTVNAVNYIQLGNSDTGNGVNISPAGTDTNINLTLTGKGNSGVAVQGNASGGLASGYVGEVIRSVVPYVTPTGGYTSGVSRNITSLVLTPGNWNIFASAGAIAGGTLTGMAAGISDTTNTLPAGELLAYMYVSSLNGIYCMSVPSVHVTILVPTTYYLVLNTEFTVSGSGFGNIYGVRIQ